MDVVKTLISNQNLGAHLPDWEETTGCPLWMDDIVLITSNPNELQKMLDITDDIAERYHIDFGKENNKVMEIEGRKKQTKFKNWNWKK